MARWLQLFTMLWLAASANNVDAFEAREAMTADLCTFLRNEYGSVEASPIPTGILYDLVLPLANLAEINETDELSLNRWIQAAHELKRASFDGSGLPSHDQFRLIGQSAAREHEHPLGILFYQYNRIRPEMQRDNALLFDGQSITGIRADALEQQELFAIASLHNYTYRGAEARFRVDLESLYFSNDPRAVQSLELDFDDGNGFQTVRSQEDVLVSYAETGHRTIRARLTLADGTVRESAGRFEVRSLRTPAPAATWSLQATTPYNGAYSTGEAYLYLAPWHTTLTRPVIVIEGFDIDNSLNWDELYALLNEQNMLETLVSLGYDAVVLNFTDAITHIQANAYLTETLIDSVNQIIDANETSVLIGASMGGLVTRYTLTHLESQNQPHRIRTWITFDSPHRGANIPLGMQYWVEFFAEESADAAFLRDALNSPAARQMLLAHFVTPPSSTPSADPLMAAFQNDLNGIGGFPIAPRRVAVANGTGSQAGMTFGPGSQLIRWEYGSWILDITGNVWALHNTQTQMIFDGEMNWLWPLPDRSMTVNVQPTWPWDNAPGGMRNSMAQMDAVDPGYGDIIALHQNHCFIPTISALDLNVSDPFHNIAGDPNLYALTEFDSLYFPVNNQSHVTITAENFEWFMQEIIEPLPAPQVVAQVENEFVRLSWPPVLGAESYRIYSAEVDGVWPVTFVATADTMLAVSTSLAELQFYRVIATTAPAELPPP